MRLVKARLDVLLKQASTNDAPSSGYRSSNANVQGTAAKRLIAAAVAHGVLTSDWQSNPRSKLQCMCKGGYSVPAQACYEVIQLGSQPDFLDRIVVMGFVTYNAKQSQNA